MIKANIVYLNGEFIPQENAKISIMDRGFLFGDGVYEVVPVFNGKMLRLEGHLTRLTNSLAAIGLTPPLTDEQIKNIFKTLLIKNNKSHDTVGLYLQITRGPQSMRSHAIPENPTPTVVAFIIPSKSMSEETLLAGCSAITLDDTRRRDCYIKAITLLPNILLYETARKAGAVEAILIRNGNALEGTSSNLFIVKNHQLYTPPLDHYILGGITRELVLEIATQNNIPYQECDISETMLFDADEIWITGSTREICPIVLLNHKPVGTGKVGPIWHQVYKNYKQHKHS